MAEREIFLAEPIECFIQKVSTNPSPLERCVHVYVCSLSLLQQKDFSACKEFCESGLEELEQQDAAHLFLFPTVHSPSYWVPAPRAMLVPGKIPKEFLLLK